MGYGFRYDATGTKCASGVRPGTLALCRWAKARWSLPLVGHFNCRPSRGGGGLSTHGEGRGGDLHVHVRASEAPPTPEEEALGWVIALFFVAAAELLGVQRVIFLDKEWDSRPGQRDWLDYTGPFHGNHVHVELCRPAAEQITTADLDAAAERYGDDMPTAQEIADAVWGKEIDLVDGKRQPAWAILRFLDARSAAALTALSKSGDIDEAALAKALAPLLASMVPRLSDTDLAAVAKAVNDEDHRRSQS